MSSHCGKYPACGCPPTTGQHCQSESSVEDIAKLNRAIDVQTKEELKTIDPKLQEAYEKLSEDDKIRLHRGYKTWKTNGKCEYILVDNNPFMRSAPGPKFTPKKKKRKK